MCSNNSYLNWIVILHLHTGVHSSDKFSKNIYHVQIYLCRLDQLYVCVGLPTYSSTPSKSPVQISDECRQRFDNERVLLDRQGTEVVVSLCIFLASDV